MKNLLLKMLILGTLLLSANAAFPIASEKFDGPPIPLCPNGGPVGGTCPLR
jgi:hypothetical protein